MSQDEFWAVIERSSAGKPSRIRQAVLLGAALREKSPEEILAFHHAFDREIRRAYSWDLWGAAYVINGGASDDGFEYFRRWLVSRGRAVFELALRKPDDLADILPSGDDEAVEFEEFMDFAYIVWREKTGRSVSAYFDALKKLSECDAKARDPSGTPFEEDEAQLSARYPKLWARFGNRPRG